IVGSMTTWYFGAAPRLAQRHRVLLFDLRGHGKSERTPTGYDLATMTGDLDALLDDFRGGPATLVGHSWGALIALRVALKRPARVRKLVLVEAPLPPSQEELLRTFLALPYDDMARALPGPLQELVARGGRAATNFVKQIAALAQSTTLLRDLAAEPDLPDDVLAGVRGPTLLVDGARSGCRDPGDRLARLIPGARLVELPGGHFLPAEAPAALTETIGGFCDG